MLKSKLKELSHFLVKERAEEINKEMEYLHNKMVFYYEQTLPKEILEVYKLDENNLQYLRLCDKILWVKENGDVVSIQYLKDPLPCKGTANKVLIPVSFLSKLNDIRMRNDKLNSDIEKIIERMRSLKSKNAILREYPKLNKVINNKKE